MMMLTAISKKKNNQGLHVLYKFYGYRKVDLAENARRSVSDVTVAWRATCPLRTWTAFVRAQGFHAKK
jgi:uncharacterized protein YcfL